MKITIKDIAKEANVSIATVSYVLNNKQNEKISLVTKNKILEIVKKYNYLQNNFAKQIGKEKRLNILFLYDLTSSFSLLKADVFSFYEKLVSSLDKRFNLSLSSFNSLKDFSSYDIIICYRLDEFLIKKLKENTFLKKLILIDTSYKNSDDNLYFINLKINKYFKDNEANFISLTIEKNLDQILKEKYHLLTFYNFKEIDYFINHNYYKDKIISFSKSLYEYLLSKGIKLTYINLDSEARLNLISSILDSIYNNKEINQHKFNA